MKILLHIYQWICQWKKIENRSTFGDVMDNIVVPWFFWLTVKLIVWGASEELHSCLKVNVYLFYIMAWTYVNWTVIRLGHWSSLSTAVLTVRLCIRKTLNVCAWGDKVPPMFSIKYSRQLVADCYKSFTLLYINSSWIQWAVRRNYKTCFCKDI